MGEIKVLLKVQALQTKIAIIVVQFLTCKTIGAPPHLLTMVKHIFFMKLNYLPLISRVRGPNGKLWTEFFPSFYGPSAKCAGHENKEGKIEDP